MSFIVSWIISILTVILHFLSRERKESHKEKTRIGSRKYKEPPKAVSCEVRGSRKSQSSEDDSPSSYSHTDSYSEFEKSARGARHEKHSNRNIEKERDTKRLAKKRHQHERKRWEDDLRRGEDNYSMKRQDKIQRKREKVSYDSEGEDSHRMSKLYDSVHRRESPHAVLSPERSKVIDGEANRGTNASIALYLVCTQKESPSSDVIRSLVNRGANVCFRPTLQGGNTPRSQRSDELILMERRHKLFLGMSSLQILISRALLECVRVCLLTPMIIDFSAVDEKGNTALHHVVLLNERPLVECMLLALLSRYEVAKGDLVDVRRRNKAGHTARDIAERKGYGDVFKDFERRIS